MTAPVAAAYVSAAVSILIALVGWAVVFGTIKSRVERQEKDYVSMGRRIDHLADKIESLNGPRIVRIEREIDRLREWRHNLENTRLGERLTERYKDKGE